MSIKCLLQIPGTYKVSYIVKYSRYNTKEKKKELDVIQQGIRLVQPEMASSQLLPAAAAKPASLPTVNFPAPFTHTLPQNTADQANVRGNRTAVPVISTVPLPIHPTPQILMLPHYPVLMARLLPKAIFKEHFGPFVRSPSHFFRSPG